jgi:hypothetical protein
MRGRDRGKPFQPVLVQGHAHSSRCTVADNVTTYRAGWLIGPRMICPEERSSVPVCSTVRPTLPITTTNAAQPGSPPQTRCWFSHHAGRDLLRFVGSCAHVA